MIEKLKEIIKNSKNICVFTGAGISCPSGVPDFRSENGLYNQKNNYNYSPEEIISHSFFVSHTDLFYEFYKTKMIYEDALPNKAHYYFANLEKQEKNVFVVTQNIDGFHQLAGSTRVFELHGSVHRNFCTKCRKFYDLKGIMDKKGVPYCDECNSVIKPDVVLYEEPLNEEIVSGAIETIQKCDTMIIIGTSLAVYPAASYVTLFGGENLVLINKSKTPYDNRANVAIYDDIINVINELEK